jgi:hypothetical protein
VVTAIVPTGPASVYTTPYAARVARIREMGVAVGDIVTLTVTKVAGYACWGESGGQTGFVHCYEWSWDRPIPDSDVPIIGESLTARVLHLIDRSRDEIPLDVTFGGTIEVDFAASVKLLRPKPEGADY